MDFVTPTKSSAQKQSVLQKEPSDLTPPKEDLPKLRENSDEKDKKMIGCKRALKYEDDHSDEAIQQESKPKKASTFENLNVSNLTP